MIIKENIINNMMDMGLNKYEAKAYLSLIDSPQITAYEISKLSGVPQAKIYETVKKLLDKNLVNIVSDNPVKYIALDMDSFLDNIKQKTEDNISYLKSNLKKLKPRGGVSYLLHLEGQENIVNKILDVIKCTNKFLYIEAWDIDYNIFSEELLELEKGGVEIISVIYGKPDKDIGKIYYHEMDGLDLDKKNRGRWFTIISDGKQSMFSIYKDDVAQGIWTENEAFMLMAESFISHDVYLAEIYLKFKEQLDQEFGPNLKKIREKSKIGHL